VLFKEKSGAESAARDHRTPGRLTLRPGISPHLRAEGRPRLRAGLEGHAGTRNTLGQQRFARLGAVVWLNRGRDPLHHRAEARRRRWAI
jgi:hypothetical protein